jgi:hypothetical protein
MKSWKARKILGITALLALLAPSAHAVTLRCDGCNFQQAENRALAAGLGDHVVLDFQYGTLWQFAISVDRDAIQIPGRPVPLTADPFEPSSQDAAQFREIAGLWKQNGGSLKLDFVIQPGDPLYPSASLTGFRAHDVTFSTSIRESIGRTVASLEFRGEAGRLVSGLQSLILHAAESVAGSARLRVIVRFPDGSSGVFVIDKDHTVQAEYELGSARDSEGNIVPDQSHVEDGPNHLALIGDSRFENPDNARDFINRARAFGIPVTDTRGQNVGRPILVNCVMENGKMKCIARFASL